MKPEPDPNPKSPARLTSLPYGSKCNKYGNIAHLFSKLAKITDHYTRCFIPMRSSAGLIQIECSML